MTKPHVKARLVSVVVQPKIMADDGTDLREIPTQPSEVAAKDLDAFPAQLRDGLAELERELNQQADIRQGPV